MTSRFGRDSRPVVGALDRERHVARLRDVGEHELLDPQSAALRVDQHEWGLNPEDDVVGKADEEEGPSEVPCLPTVRYLETAEWLEFAPVDALVRPDEPRGERQVIWLVVREEGRDELRVVVPRHPWGIVHGLRLGRQRIHNVVGA